jgi:hypothetical protein
MAKTIKINDKNLKIVFAFRSDEKVKEEMSFEDAKYFLMKNQDKIDYVRIDSEKEFSKEEFVFLTFFESFEYFTKNISISSMKNRFSTFQLENVFSVSIFFDKSNSDRFIIYSETFIKKVAEYKNYFPYIFNKNGIETKYENETLYFKKGTDEWILKSEGLFIINDGNMSSMKFFTEDFKENKKMEKRECKGEELTINFGKGMYFSSFKINFEENKIVLYHYLECGREFVYDLKTKELTTPSFEEKYSITEIETFFQSFGKTFEKLIEKSEKAINIYISNDLSFYINAIRKKFSEIKRKAETNKLSETKEKQEIDKKISERMQEI